MVVSAKTKCWLENDPAGYLADVVGVGDWALNLPRNLVSGGAVIRMAQISRTVAAYLEGMQRGPPLLF